MWGVLTADRHAKLIVSVGDGLVVVVSQTDTQALYVDADGGGKGSIAKIAGSGFRYTVVHVHLVEMAHLEHGDFVWRGNVAL